MGIEKYNDFQNKMKELKAQALKDIINDNELSKVDKLKLISNNDLMETNSCVCDPFEKYQDDYLTKVASDPNYEYRKYYTDINRLKSSVIVDDFFTNRDYQRHQVVDLSEIASYIDSEDPNDKILIYTNRSSKLKCFISPKEAVDTIYDWVISNNTIAFEIDW